MIPTVLAYLIVVSFLVLEGRARKGPAASSLERQPFDRGSTGAIGLAFLLAEPIRIAFAPRRRCCWAPQGTMSTGLTLEVDSVRLLRSRALGPTDKAE